MTSLPFYLVNGEPLTSRTKLNAYYWLATGNTLDRCKAHHSLTLLIRHCQSDSQAGRLAPRVMVSWVQALAGTSFLVFRIPARPFPTSTKQLKPPSYVATCPEPRATWSWTKNTSFPGNVSTTLT
jgi:hypothetical protein